MSKNKYPLASQGYFYPENFAIGTTSGAEFSFGVSCCIPTVTVSATDVANNNNVCYSGRRDGSLDAGAVVSTAEVAVIAVVIVLVIVIVAATAGFLYIRKRRQAELAEMTSLPQQR